MASKVLRMKLWDDEAGGRVSGAPRPAPTPTAGSDADGADGVLPCRASGNGASRTLAVRCCAVCRDGLVRGLLARLTAVCSVSVYPAGADDQGNQARLPRGHETRRGRPPVPLLCAQGQGGLRRRPGAGRQVSGHDGGGAGQRRAGECVRCGQGIPADGARSHWSSMPLPRRPAAARRLREGSQHPCTLFPGHGPRPSWRQGSQSWCHVRPTEGMATIASPARDGQASLTRRAAASCMPRGPGCRLAAGNQSGRCAGPGRVAWPGSWRGRRAGSPRPARQAGTGCAGAPHACMARCDETRGSHRRRER